MAEEEQKELKKVPVAKKEARKPKRTGEGDKAEKPEKPDKKEKTGTSEEAKKKRRRNKNRPGRRNRELKAKKEAYLKKQAAQEDSEEEDGEESEEEGAAEEGAAEEGAAEEGAAPGEVVAKPRKTKANRLNEAKYDRPQRGVLFIGQLPKGFEEPQIRQYFKQFGRVTRSRLARGKKFGNSRGYGWVEYAEMEVAEIVQKTMDKYMMFGKVMQVVLMPPEQVHGGIFHKWNKKWIALGLKNKRDFNMNFNDRPWVEVDGEQLPQRTWAQVRRRDKKMNILKGKLEQLGIEYDLTPFFERHDEETERCQAEFEAKKARLQAAAEAAEAAKVAKRAAKPAAEAPAKGLKGKKEAKAAKAAEAEAPEEAAEAPDAEGEAKAKKKKRKASEAEEAQPSGEAAGAPEKKLKKKKAQEA